jgi:Domain of unknown function (DUF4157)
MRMPWQRRSAGRAEPETVATPGTTPHAWRSAAPLTGSAGGPPPLTARSVELADALSRRLRSTRDRPPLLHRAGFPDAAPPGTVRGIAVASPVALTRRTRSASGATLQDGEPTPDDAVEATAPVVMAPPVRARRSRSHALTSVDPAALVFPVRETVEQVQAEETEQGDDAGAETPPAAAGPPPGLQHTVIRRRAGVHGARPLGLQAPLDDPATKAASERSAELERTAQQPPTEPAPHAVASEVGRLHRADVGNVLVHRGDEAERVTADAHARAVTRGGEVFIPDAAGPLDTGTGRGLLAHELTHVIQQRRLGASVPLEHSPAGRRLESEASMTERHVRGDAGAPAPPPAASPPATPPAASQPATPGPSLATPAPPADDDDARSTARDIQEELVASGRAFRMPDGSIVFPGSGMHLPEQRPSHSQPALVMQRAPDDSDLTTAEDPASGSGGVFTPPSDTGYLPMPDIAAPPSAPTPVPSTPAPAQSRSHPVAAAAPATATAAAATAPSQAAPARAPEPGPSQAAPALAPEPAPPLDLDELARRVYGQVRTQLRSELLIDRERAGLLTDFR